MATGKEETEVGMKAEIRNRSLSPGAAKDGGKDGDEFTRLGCEDRKSRGLTDVETLAEQQPILGFSGFLDGDGYLVGKVIGRFSAVGFAIIGPNGGPGTQ